MRKINLENEKKFQNRKSSGENIRSKQSKYYWATFIPTQNHKKKTFEVIKNSKVLEIGCANGDDASDYCKFASSYIGVDISNVAIKNCNALSIKNAKFYCGDGHKLPVKDKSINYVIVNSLLHHLDLEVSLKEISRVLSDNGGLIFREPIGINPIFQLYRMITPMARTIDERPFTFHDLTLMKKYFFLNEVQFFGFFNIISAFISYRKLRYILTFIDTILSYTPIKYFYWQFCGVAKKKIK